MRVSHCTHWNDGLERCCECGLTFPDTWLAMESECRPADAEAASLAADWAAREGARPTPEPRP